MSHKMFVNLPVSDLPASTAFFRALGFEFNPQFSDETAACMIISEANYVMLLTHPKFGPFTPRPISDAHTATEVIVALSCDSRAQVDTMLESALSQQGREIGQPQDHGFMYLRTFEDLDGHIWEVFWMDMQAMQEKNEEAQ